MQKEQEQDRQTDTSRQPDAEPIEKPSDLPDPEDHDPE